MEKIVLLVDYNEHFKAGDEAPAELAEKLVKAGLAERQCTSAPAFLEDEDD